MDSLSLMRNIPHSVDPYGKKNNTAKLGLEDTARVHELLDRKIKAMDTQVAFYLLLPFERIDSGKEKILEMPTGNANRNGLDYFIMEHIPVPPSTPQKHPESVASFPIIKRHTFFIKKESWNNTEYKREGKGIINCYKCCRKMYHLFAS